MEVQFSEFLYDIKIFMICKITNRDVIAYQIEIFCINDPNVCFVYNYPMNYQEGTQDPHTLVIDVFNLIEHPFKIVEKSKGKLLSRDSQIVASPFSRPQSNNDDDPLNSNASPSPDQQHYKTHGEEKPDDTLNEVSQN